MHGCVWYVCGVFAITDGVCCSLVPGTLVGVFVFSVIWSELLITSAITCPL